jgi:hypothetical protein
VKPVHVVAGLLTGVICTTILAAIFGSVVYCFGFGFTLVVHVLQSIITGVWHTRHGPVSSWTADALGSQALILLIALTLISVGLYEVVLWE